ncbi:hypothetical protein GCM10007916_12580 [Psychromonas marina]|uniref:N-acetyltransferase domain-containing protein n=1 Tax=Psychromonas marina TaxID=88364 RepID=A0ABQ6DYF8_9GAMM|nr:GNAT family N-acetyltransferase [Psychromonas marina]GLS90191.1 hypothetical protein GCM10007916_12580 [Psychromonas marina]
MEVSLNEIKLESRHVLENLFPYYIYDMSEYMGWAPSESGLFTYNADSLDLYWNRSDHFPFFIYVGEELAGFVLIRKYPENESVYDIAQFFVLRKFKGKGVGKKSLELVVGLFPGKWQIRVLIENDGALIFWQSAVANIVGEHYEQTKSIDVDLLMHFLSFEV